MSGILIAPPEHEPLLLSEAKAFLRIEHDDDDAVISSLIVAARTRITEDNAGALGKGYSDGDLYLAHFAGIAAAKRLLKASADMPVADLMSAAAVNANAGILKGKTAGQVRVWASRKMSAAKGRGWIAKLYGGAVVVAETTPTRSEDARDVAPAAAARHMPTPAKLLIALVVLMILIAMALLGVG